MPKRSTRLISMLLLLATPAVAGAAPFAYVANHGANVVSVIDVASATVVATIPVDGDPLGVAVGPFGTRAYIANQKVAGTVTVIDGVTQSVVTTIPVGARPSGVAVKLPGTKVYVSNRDDKTVSVIDAATDTVIGTIPVGNNPLGIAVNPAGTPAYVVNKGSDSVSVIDTNTDTVRTTIGVGNDPMQVAVSPNGMHAYVTNNSGAAVSVIDTGTNTVIDTIAVGNMPQGVAFEPSGARAWVTNSGPNTVSVIDTATRTVIRTVAVGTNPWSVALTPDGNRAFVANRGGASVSVIDTATFAVGPTIALGQGPVALGEFIAPALTAPLFGRAVRACQVVLATRGRQLASKDQSEETKCQTRLLTALATGSGMAKAEVACTLALDLANPLSKIARVQSRARSNVLRRCAGLVPADLHTPCNGAAADFGGVADCMLGRQMEGVAAMVAATWADDAPPALDKDARGCQLALAGRAKKFAEAAHKRLDACLIKLLQAAAGRRGTGSATVGCLKALDLRSPASTLAKARARTATGILKKCAGVTPAALGSPCDDGAATIATTVGCVLDTHLEEVARMIATKFNDACPMLTGLGLGGAYPGACTGP